MNSRNYQNFKIKSYLINNELLFFLNGNNQTRGNWLQIEQGLKRLKLIYYKIYNKLLIKSFSFSIFSNLNKLVSGPFFLIKLDQFFLKMTLSLVEDLKKLFFNCLVIKINNKIYSFLQFKNLRSFSYINNTILLYQFLLTNLKMLSMLKNIETMWFEHMTSCSQNRHATNCVIFRNE